MIIENALSVSSHNESKGNWEVERRFDLSTLILMASSAFAPIVVVAASAEPDACVTAYQGTLAEYYDRSVLVTTVEFWRAKVCGNSNHVANDSTNAGLTAVIYGVPITASWATENHVTDVKSFCDAASRDQFAQWAAQDHYSKPAVAAQHSFNDCERILNGSNVSVTDVPRPGFVDVHFASHDSDARADLEGVTAPGFQCQIPGYGKVDETTRHRFDVPFTIHCSRSSKQQTNGDELFKAATVIVNTSKGQYTVDLGDETVYGPATASAYKQELALLKPDAEDDKVWRSSAISIYPFYIYDGEGAAGFSGDRWAWHDVAIAQNPASPIAKLQPNLENILKARYCPDAIKTYLKQIAFVSQGNQGSFQFVYTCIKPVRQPLASSLKIAQGPSS
jgi:hypothetical protein